MEELENIQVTKTIRLRIAVLALFVVETEVLMIHQMTSPDPDRWDLPGGGMEPHESLPEALKREVREETGIEQFQIDRLLTINERFIPKTENHLLHGINIIYQCSLPSKLIRLYSDDLEIGPKGIQWLSIASLSPAACTHRSWQALQAAGLVNIE